ncbi:MAG: hypothetical protein KKH99_14315, partial [Proteobacteria bacterium]|nr:hypothetical protein [Pseudomonadota bacterium]
MVKVDILNPNVTRDINYTYSDEFCGDHVCSAAEACDTCPYDCGLCNDESETEAGCIPDWECGEWTPCLPIGIMTRECTDKRNCDDERTMPDVARLCIYNATCKDGLKNGIEEGVDCGGPCDTCPTCEDGIQNQGEQDVDCGGPCIDVCPSCTDGITNQNESDIDCGRECVQCIGGQSCLKNNDCESLRCEYLVCTTPSCDDQIRNQDEESIDCGGICPKQCGNCSDGIQNRGEEGVDCGGFCRLCPNCFDSIKNQDETIVDCGGSCRPCIFIDYFQRYLLIAIIIIILFVFLPVFLIWYFFNLMKTPETARKIYDSDSGFAF